MNINDLIINNQRLKEIFVDSNNNQLLVGDFVRINRIIHDKYKNQMLYKICFYPFGGIYFTPIGLYKNEYLEEFLPLYKRDFKYECFENQWTMLHNIIKGFTFGKFEDRTPSFYIDECGYAHIEKLPIESEFEKIDLNWRTLCVAMAVVDKKRLLQIQQNDESFSDNDMKLLYAKKDIIINALKGDNQ